MLKTLKNKLVLLVTGLVILTACTTFIKFRPVPDSAEALLKRADEMAWANNWIGAEPLFHKAEALFRQQGDPKHALYARVSQVPAHMESKPLSTLIAEANQYISQPEASEPEIRLRILIIKAMLELEYDAALAQGTWRQVEQLANDRHELRLASRASGEQGILAFLLGDIREASARVKKAYMTAKVLRDPAAQVRYAELIGRGLAELGRYQESLRWSDEAISLASRHPEMALPTIAFDAKVRALAGVGRYKDAEHLIDQTIAMYRSRHLAEHLCSQLITKGEVLETEGRWSSAISAYTESEKLGTKMQYWHGLTEASGRLAKAYEHEGQLQPALQAINRALFANRQTPDEVYFVPRNLAIKAEIEAKLGHRKQSELLYLKGSDVLDGLLAKAPTSHIEQILLTDLSELYSGYFSLLSSTNRYEQAFEVIEKAHGRIEAQALEFDRTQTPHNPTELDKQLDELEGQLLETDDRLHREKLLSAIYEAESKIDPAPMPTSQHPVPLQTLQKHLTADELVLEYVLAEPQSYVLAISQHSVHCYPLANKKTIELAAAKYRNLLRHRQTDIDAGRQLFDTVLKPITEYENKSSIIVVADGQLNLLPFSSLVDNSGTYVVSNKLISYSSSGTVLSFLRTRSYESNTALPYLGVAAWTQTTDNRPWVVRAVAGPQRLLLLPLPASKKEVETIAELMPRPGTVLLGSEATKQKFVNLPLEKYDVLHLALHGYADTEFPDRSALIFAPRSDTTKDSSLLKAREIRRLHLNARLITLSACNTGVGPVSEAGVANLSSAFIQAGAQSVVSTLWELEDSSTSQLMQTFYNHLSHGVGRAEALRQAQVSLLQAGKTPYYWASFELVGDAAKGLVPSNGILNTAQLSMTQKESR